MAGIPGANLPERHPHVVRERIAALLRNRKLFFLHSAASSAFHQNSMMNEVTENLFNNFMSQDFSSVAIFSTQTHLAFPVAVIEGTV